MDDVIVFVRENGHNTQRTTPFLLALGMIRRRTDSVCERTSSTKNGRLKKSKGTYVQGVALGILGGGRAPIRW